MRPLPFLILALFTFSTASAETTLLTRFDGTAQKGSLTLGLITPTIEVYRLYASTPYEEYELGRLQLVHSTKQVKLLFGGYVTYQPKTHEADLLPWAILNAHQGGLHYHAELAYYQPLNGGRPVIWSNECSIAHPVGKRLEAGFLFNFWAPKGVPLTYALGPKLSAELGKGVSLNARVMLFGKVGKPTYRIALTQSF